MIDLFLIGWFYLYAGLLFGSAINSVALFPGIGLFWKVIGWPVFFAEYIFNRIIGKY